MLMEGFMTACAIPDSTGNICADHTVYDMCKVLGEQPTETSISGITNRWEKKQD